jgi:hypothetical protein
MVERIIEHNINVFSREMERLRMQEVQPVERIRALQNHLKKFEKAKTIPKALRSKWVKMLVEHALSDPELDQKLKDKLKDAGDEGKGIFVDTYA